GLEIAPGFRPAGFEQYATFHPTFLYELIWDVAVAVAVVLLDRRFRLGHGKAFALYVLLYTAGRFWIEALRIDTVNEVGGFRLNNYTSAIVFVGAALVLAWLVKNRPGREDVVEDPAADATGTTDPQSPDDAGASEAEQEAESTVPTDSTDTAGSTDAAGPGRTRVDP
ncbi:MAG: prolipoprotein diacylglyceryl transferase, partial [Propionibacteriaceae bacterium]